MQYTEFKGKKLSRLGLGTLRLPEKEDGNLSIEEVIRMVDCAIEGGINYFDTAYSYGGEQAEQALGLALSRYPRESYFLADKLPTWRCREKRDAEKIFHQQLQRCRSEFFDFYLIHSIKDERYGDIERLSLMPYLHKEKARGRIRHIGASVHCSPQILRRLLQDYEELEFIQLQLNYMDWEYFREENCMRSQQNFKSRSLLWNLCGAVCWLIRPAVQLAGFSARQEQARRLLL